jgi:uncharacterized membrane protein
MITFFQVAILISALVSLWFGYKRDYERVLIMLMWVMALFIGYSTEVNFVGEYLMVMRYEQ